MSAVGRSADRLRASGERFALIFTQPFRRLRRRVDAWIMTRTKRQHGPIVISRRRVYIVPTRYGYAYAVMLLVMLLGAMNYSNSMAFALTFLLSGLGLIGMHHTHGNLVNLRLLTLRARPVHAGEDAEFELEIENLAPKARWTLTAAWTRESAADSVDVYSSFVSNLCGWAADRAAGEVRLSAATQRVRSPGKRCIRRRFLTEMPLRSWLDLRLVDHTCRRGRRQRGRF